jgi:electron transfer flavoprotein alpha/beta subunit
MKAKKKPITEWNAEALGLKVEDLKTSSKVEVTDIQTPEVKRKRVVIKADKVEEAVSKLVLALTEVGVLG